MEPNLLDHMYILTKGNSAYYINPTADGSINWQSIQFAREDSEEDFEN
jgi:hypothetical protein